MGRCWVCGGELDDGHYRCAPPARSRQLEPDDAQENEDDDDEDDDEDDDDDDDDDDDLED